MSALAGGWEPLSVRRGIREPFRLLEGIPEHGRPLIDDWVERTFRLSGRSPETDVRFVVTMLRLDFTCDYPRHLIANLRHDDDRYLDLLDLLTFMQPAERDDLELILATSGSAWRVDFEEGRLYRRVPEEAQAAYELALEREPSAADHLSGAWEHAFGRNPDAGDAWGDAIRAVEAALHPIVTPGSDSSTLGKMKGDLRRAPEGKFIVRAPGDSAMQTLLGMLDAVPYEEGRHGSDPGRASLDMARVVVFQATAIVAGIGEGLIERAEG